jgi:capsular polysaccharide export protein
MSDALYAHGFSWRKRALVRGFAGRSDISFVASGKAVPAGARLLLWGSSAAPQGLPDGVRLVRIEDGFLRSVGLGADLTRPMSWVLDEVGIYYDATRPSALEQGLSGTDWAPAQLERAARFRERLVAAGLTKYNLAAAPWRRPEAARRVVLVPGQVESDASIGLGAVDVRTNFDLLQAARAARPDAWIVYKPHPDVVAGLRGAGRGEQRAAELCDEIVTEGAMQQMLALVDEVHVMTSLTGFEALLRSKPVVCHGLPFYAGWGLTEDRHVAPRRGRRLSLDQLVAGALLDYPSYMRRATNQLCSPEQALEELLAWRADRPAGIAPWRKWLRPWIARP